MAWRRWRRTWSRDRRRARAYASARRAARQARCLPSWCRRAQFGGSLLGVTCHLSDGWSNQLIKREPLVGGTRGECLKGCPLPRRHALPQLVIGLIIMQWLCIERSKGGVDEVYVHAASEVTIRESALLRNEEAGLGQGADVDRARGRLGILDFGGHPRRRASGRACFRREDKESLIVAFRGRRGRTESELQRLG